ncbi:Quercetin 2,3-dioxygenase [compost metagenome]
MQNVQQDRELTTRVTRPIARVYSAPGLHWVGDGFRVMGFMSAYPELTEALNPFLLLDYHPPYDYTPTTHRRGVGPHPHRGFETVTLAFEGSVAHHDSTGNAGVIGPGDVQWMTAASGILHKEYHEENFSRQGGTFHMAQIWVNLPKADKMGPPRYNALNAEDMGLVSLPNEGGSVRVIAGEYEGIRGPAKPFSPISMFDVLLNPNGEATFSIPNTNNLAVLIMAGDVTFNGLQKASVNELVVFANDGEHITVKAGPASRLLVLAGEPIREPIVSYGPFVMNSAREIQEAFRDYSRGAFGHLED